jgi:hypothetical protein
VLINTHDFLRIQIPFDRYDYRVRKILEQVKDLALLHPPTGRPREYPHPL